MITRLSLFTRFQFLLGTSAMTLALAIGSACAQPPERDRPERDRPDGDRPPRGQRDDNDERPPRDRADGDRPGGPELAPEVIAKRWMERFDKDGDQKLNAEELVAALQEMRPRGPRGGRPEGDRGPRPDLNPTEMVSRMMETNDKDGDGKLTGEEIPERMRRNIDRIDANADGSIDKAELETAFGRMREGRPGGDRPREGSGRAGDGGDRPRDGGDRPREGGDRPRDGGDRPRDGGDRPRDGGDRPRDGGDRPRRPPAE